MLLNLDKKTPIQFYFPDKQIISHLQKTNRLEHNNIYFVTSSSCWSIIFSCFGRTYKNYTGCKKISEKIYTQIKTFFWYIHHIHISNCIVSNSLWKIYTSATKIFNSYSWAEIHLFNKIPIFFTNFTKYHKTGWPVS